VPTLSPTVIVILRVCLSPDDTMHLMDESASQSVASHGVLPSLTIEEVTMCPREHPCTVTLVDPVPPLFARRSTLNAPASCDHPSVKLPPRSPIVNETRRDPRTPVPVMQRTDVSASQSVPSHSECPIAPTTV
jgi:hypothetical protein